MVCKFLGVINSKEFMKMAVRNMYTFFVVERALIRAKHIQEQNVASFYHSLGNHHNGS